MEGTTWIIVADAARARVLRWRVADASLDEVEAIAHVEGRVPARDLVTDGPGRTRGGKGVSSRSSMDPSTDPRDAEADRFARELAETLETAAGKRYGRLVLVAPPAFLGRLRSALGKGATALLVETVTRDFTRVRPSELAPRLSSHLSWLKPQEPPRHLPAR